MRKINIYNHNTLDFILFICNFDLNYKYCKIAYIYELYAILGRHRKGK